MLRDAGFGWYATVAHDAYHAPPSSPAVADASSVGREPVGRRHDSNGIINPASARCDSLDIAMECRSGYATFMAEPELFSATF